MPAPAQPAQRLPHPQQIRRRRRPQRHNHLRLHHIDLPHQKLRAGVGLHRLRHPVIPRRSALDYVGDVDLARVAAPSRQSCCSAAVRPYPRKAHPAHPRPHPVPRPRTSAAPSGDPSPNTILRRPAYASGHRVQSPISSLNRLQRRRAFFDGNRSRRSRRKIIERDELCDLRPHQTRGQWTRRQSQSPELPTPASPRSSQRARG
jgi:hypothetical protein